MTKKTKIWFVIIICFAVVLDLLYLNIKPSASAEDIKVEATLKMNDTTANPHKEYLIDINIMKSKDCNIAIYPYIDGLGVMTFNVDEQEDYYIPSSIGVDGTTAEIAKTELRKNNLIQNEEELSLTGFWFPEQAGTYKAKMYLEMLDDFNKIENPILVCVYQEEKFGKHLSWAKIVSVNIE